MNILKSKAKYPNIETVGIGLTNKCNLNCPHCYSRKLAGGTLELADIRRILSVFPRLKSVNFGTGESILNNQFDEIVDLFHGKNIDLAITSNGLSVNGMEKDTLVKFDDVDISLDFPIAELHDKWRGKKGLFNGVIRAIEKCKKYDINVSIVAVLMSNNYNYFPKFRNILDNYGINLRINVYKPAHTKIFAPSYNQFWGAIKTFCEKFELISCSEPVLAVILGGVENGSSCGNSTRIHPDGIISPCVYVSNDNITLEIFNKNKRKLPEFCKDCSFAQRCRGGCYGRKILENRESLPDSYCPFYNNKEVPDIKFKKSKEREKLIHSNYLCTIILK